MKPHPTLQSEIDEIISTTLAVAVITSKPKTRVKAKVAATKALQKLFVDWVNELIGEDEEVITTTWDCPCGSTHTNKTDPTKRNKLRQEIRERLDEMSKA